MSWEDDLDNNPMWLFKGRSGTALQLARIIRMHRMMYDNESRAPVGGLINIPDHVADETFYQSRVFQTWYVEGTRGIDREWRGPRGNEWVWSYLFLCNTVEGIRQRPEARRQLALILLAGIDGAGSRLPSSRAENPVLRRSAMRTPGVERGSPTANEPPPSRGPSRSPRPLGTDHWSSNGESPYGPRYNVFRAAPRALSNTVPARNPSAFAEPVIHPTGRSFEFAASTVTAARTRQGGLCAQCGHPLADVLEEAHHAVPNQTGDPSNPQHNVLRSEDNCVVLCDICHYAVHDSGRFRQGAVPPPDYYRHSHGRSPNALHDSWVARVREIWRLIF